MSIEYAKYDRRIVNLTNPPSGYAEYIDSLICCICNSVDSCNCVFKPILKRKPKKRIEIKSVCSPHRDWIQRQINLGVNGREIYRGLIYKFGFRNSYTSVKNFVRKLKGLQYNA